MEVEIYDNGHWTNPTQHTNERGELEPLKGHLCYVPGALLDTRTGTFDEDEVTTKDENGNKQLNQEKFTAFYEKRLLPVLSYINENSTKEHPAFVTIPGLGEGRFGGIYGSDGKKIVGEFLQTALEQILEKHGQKYPNIKGIYYSPEKPKQAGTKNINGCNFIVSNGFWKADAIQLLSKPETFGKQYKDCTLFKLGAWDHYSYPGNDFFINSRHTDDAVSAAATNSMQVLFDIEGKYVWPKFLPKDNSNTQWKEKFEDQEIELTGEPIICEQALMLQKTYLTTGTYNPPYLGHLLGHLEHIRKTGGVAPTFYISPAGPWYTGIKSPQNNGIIALDSEIRIKMLQKLIEIIQSKHPEYRHIKVEVHDWESKHEGKGWIGQNSYPDYPEVYKHIKTEKGLEKLTYLAGADLFKKMLNNMKTHTEEITRDIGADLSSSKLWGNQLSAENLKLLKKYHYADVLGIAKDKFTAQIKAIEIVNDSTSSSLNKDQSASKNKNATLSPSTVNQAEPDKTNTSQSNNQSPQSPTSVPNQIETKSSARESNNQNAQSRAGFFTCAIIGAIAGVSLGYYVVAPFLLALAAGTTLPAIITTGVIVAAATIVVGLIVGIAGGFVGKRIDSRNGYSSMQDNQKETMISQGTNVPESASCIGQSSQVQTSLTQALTIDK
ncbi:hypothetical protein N9Y17_03920, partial [Gammaproteobacteria bacterium]|nr:hypothetical protein [Gammaproteobacteria bacterium]